REHPLVFSCVGLFRLRCLGRATEVIPPSFVRYILFRVLHIRGAVLLSSRWDASPRTIRLASSRHLCHRRNSALSPALSSIVRPSMKLHTRPNQSMKPTAPDRFAASGLATTPCRGLSLSR